MVHIASKVEPLAETQIEALGIAGVSTPDVDMSRLVDRLSAKVGARNVYRLEPVQSLCPSV